MTLTLTINLPNSNPNLGNAKDAHPFFTQAGHPCPKNFNPSDFFLDILSPDSRNPEIEKIADERIQTIGDFWDARSEDFATSFTVRSNNVADMKVSGEKTDLTRIIRNFKLLCWRSFAEQSREIPTIIIKLCVTTFFGLIIGGIYSNAGYGQDSIYDRTGLLFIILLNQAFNGTIGVLNSFPKEKIIVNRLGLDFRLRLRLGLG